MAQGKKSWRELCAAVTNEADPTKLFALTEELISAFDESSSTVSCDKGSYDTEEDKACRDTEHKPIVDVPAASESLPADLPLTAVQSHTPSASPI